MCTVTAFLSKYFFFILLKKINKLLLFIMSGKSIITVYNRPYRLFGYMHAANHLQDLFDFSSLITNICH